MMTFEQEKMAIKDTISRFPKYFNLPDVTGACRISEASSYFSGHTLYLYVEVNIDNQWLSYAKGTETELKQAIRRAESQREASNY